MLDILIINLYTTSRLFGQPFEKQARILGTNGGNSRSVHESFQHEHHRTECPKSLSTTGQVGKKPVMADDIYTTDKIPSMKMEGSFSVL